MKKALVIMAGLIGWSIPAFAAIDTVDAPIVSYGTPTAVSISTSAYTNATTSGVRISGMSGVLIDNPSTNNATVHGHIGNCTSTAVSISSVKGPIEIPAAGSTSFISLTEDACLWLVSRHTAAESITIQAVRQYR